MIRGRGYGLFVRLDRIFNYSMTNPLNGFLGGEDFFLFDLLLPYPCEGECPFDVSVHFVIGVFSEVGMVDVDVFINVPPLSLRNPSPIRDRTFDASQSV